MASAGAETTVPHARRGTAHFGGPNDGEGFRARDVLNGRDTVVHRDFSVFLYVSPGSDGGPVVSGLLPAILCLVVSSTLLQRFHSDLLLGSLSGKPESHPDIRHPEGICGCPDFPLRIKRGPSSSLASSPTTPSGASKGSAHLSCCLLHFRLRVEQALSRLREGHLLCPLPRPALFPCSSCRLRLYKYEVAATPSLPRPNRSIRGSAIPSSKKYFIYALSSGHAPPSIRLRACASGHPRRKLCPGF